MPLINKLYIDGRFCDAASGRKLSVKDPATGEEIASIAYGGREDAARAVEAATIAFPKWRDTNVYQRAAMLHKAADLMRERLDKLAELLTREVGKPLAESKGELAGSAAALDWCAEEAKRYFGDVIPSNVAEKRLLTMRMPVGVCAGIAPWNFPVLLLARKLAPALAVGCAMVCRSASQTPLASMEFFHCLHDAGFPPGAINLIAGPPKEQTDEFLDNPAVRKISFTGSVAVGKELMAGASRQMKRLSLELGGHAPFIVCPDAEIKRAAALAVQGKFRNMGQVCISPSRFFVSKDKAEAFAEEAAALASRLRIGAGLDPKTQVGPLVDELRVAATQALVDDIRQKGGTILCGGKKPEGKQYEKGSFYEPTVAANLSEDSLILVEEPFAPILPVIPYDELDEAIDKANSVPFGLAAYVVTQDLSSAFRVSERLEAGVVGVNDFSPAAAQAPFGGVKESGIGREGSHHALDAYTEIKCISIVV